MAYFIPKIDLWTTNDGSGNYKPRAVVFHLRINFLNICSLTQSTELMRAEIIVMETRSREETRKAGVDRHTVLSEASENEK
jgi:hypothetical protein